MRRVEREKQNKEMEEVFAIMGIALATLHEIEREFAEAHLVGMPEREKRKHRTVGDLLNARTRMTFGRLVAIMKEQWILKPEIEELLDWFVDERNRFIHSMTTLDGFNPRYKRQRDRLRSRVLHFTHVATLVRRIFRAANFASNDFAQWWLKKHAGVDIPLPCPPEIQNEIALFHELMVDLRVRT